MTKQVKKVATPKKTGFARLSKAKRAEISRKGGVAAQKKRAAARRAEKRASRPAKPAKKGK